MNRILWTGVVLLASVALTMVTALPRKGYSVVAGRPADSGMVELAEATLAAWQSLLPSETSVETRKVSHGEALYERERLLLSVRQTEAILRSQGMEVALHAPLSGWLQGNATAGRDGEWQQGLLPYMRELVAYLEAVRSWQQPLPLRSLQLFPDPESALPALRFEFAAAPDRLQQLIFGASLLERHWELRELELSRLDDPHEWWGMGTFLPTSFAEHP
jgi:hypothetical protein